jgi:hypothetical protein
MIDKRASTARDRLAAENAAIADEMSALLKAPRWEDPAWWEVYGHTFHRLSEGITELRPPDQHMDAALNGTERARVERQARRPSK